MSPQRLASEICSKLVAADPGQQGAAGREADQRRVEVRVEGPEQAVSREHVLGELADDVELVVVLETSPLVESEMPHDALLPVRLVRQLDRREDVRGRDRKRQPFRARDARRQREHRRGIAAAGEAHEARRAGDSVEHGTLQRGAR